ncbi:hypothetical protein O3M35_005770 [Rhynocoris fuscipes]|uniref:Sister chromatid cohesion protein DCC1 n=1 Tax=Rhynocoris fuscipes TaxID=488301 RepID=A0AAW1DLH2_9HEMI
MDQDPSLDSYQRTIEDVEVVISHAKLDVNELRPLSQVIYFAKKVENYKFLELDPDVHGSLNEGCRVMFKGEPNDSVVLCTKDKTYEVKEAETSNSLLLIPGMKFVEDVPATKSERQLEFKEIVGIFHDYYEIKKIKPRLSRLRTLLNRKPYKGKELEEDEQLVDYYSTEDLLKHVQASEDEIKQGLKEIDAFCLNGKWRLFEDNYHFRALSYMLNLLDENSWKINEVPLGETLEFLNELLPKEIASHIVEMYLEPTGELNDDGDTLMQVKEEKTCRYLGAYLLRQAAKFSLKDFLDAWQDSVPEGLTTNLKQLAGIALYSMDTNPQLIWYFPEEDLPVDYNERFSLLFKQREKWTFDEIEPYVRKLATEKQSANAILTKFARASNVNGTKFYSSRHGK